MHSSSLSNRIEHGHFAEPATRPRGRALAGDSAPALTLEVHDGLEPLEAVWRSLEQVPSCPIHQTYDWCRAWAEATNARIAVVLGRIGDAPVLLLPLEIVRRGGIRIARYVAAPFSNINNGIFTDAARLALAGGEGAKQFTAALRALKLGADCLVLDKVPLAWRGVPHPLASLPHVENQNEAFQITLDGSFETVIGRTNAKRKRKKFRMSTRRLEAAGGWEHVIAEEPDEALAILETFFRQKAERLRANGLPDVFAPAQVRAFFRALAGLPGGTSRRQLQLHAIRLKQDGALCAIAGTSIKGDHLICQFASIDETLCPDTSPGELLFHLMIEKACRDGLAIFDFGIGDERYKRSWCDVTTKHFDFVVPLTFSGGLYAAGYKGVVAAKRFIKHNPKAFEIASRIRAAKTATSDRSD